MKKNLVIVESPAKAKTIEKFLGEDYKVMSSYGHIRDLKKRTFSVDTKTFEPQYEVPEEKKKVVADLRRAAEYASMVWLASDEDREGEAISWHLKEVLGLDDANTKRIVFHEITKPAILEAIEHPRTIDKNLVDAQQARRVLDRIVGFRISPILWRKVRPSLSAGRVQSVAVRLIVEREREVREFRGDDYFRVVAVFLDAEGNTLKAELCHKFAKEEEARAFLEVCSRARFTVDDLQTRPITRCPAPPFTTSTLQQEAAHKLHFSVAQTMRVAQQLYENGHITYMRTDSTNLSNLCLHASKAYITANMGKDYTKPRRYQTKVKGAQEAHEAIRPTYMEKTTIEGSPQECKLYDLIWRRTIACQMADAQMERTTATIGVSGSEHSFAANGEVVKFDGFLRVYMETEDENEERQETNSSGIPPLRVGQTLTHKEVSATQRFAQHPFRYNEAGLVRKLEELGIGRPSTYATTITTIQQRGYVQKTDIPGKSVDYTTLTLTKGGKVGSKVKQTTVGAERGRLVPTDTGMVVNDFLMEFFPSVLDYNFTAEVENNFDEIAEGKEKWGEMIRDFYKEFIPMVEKADSSQGEHRLGERVLGKDPQTGKTVTAKLGRFGPMVQMGTAQDEEKPRFAQLGKGQRIDTLTLDEALQLFQLPRVIGEWNGKDIKADTSKYGPYVVHDGVFASIPEGTDPQQITLEQAMALIEEKRSSEARKHLKSFSQMPGLEVKNGRYGPYLCYKGTNYRLPKKMHERAMELTVEECKEVMEKSKKPQ